MTLLFLIPAAVCLLSLSADGEEDLRAVTPGSSKPIVGRWVLDRQGQSAPPRPQQRERGLQTSGLCFDDGILWSIGDQRSEFSSHLLRIDPETARLRGDPIPLEIAAGGSPQFEVYRRHPHPDFEGLTLHPSRPNTFLAVTENTHQWILEIRLTRAAEGSKEEKAPPWRATVVQVAELKPAESVSPFRGDLNSRFEGIAAGRETDTVYLAYERVADGHPKVFRFSAAEASRGKAVSPTEIPLDFAAIARRTDKPQARLNLNGLAVVDLHGRETLLAVARDQERLLVCDPAAAKIVSVIDLQLRAPDNSEILWVSPEGIAADSKKGRLWIISDPDSIRGNYRKLATEAAEGFFRDLTPLLFEYSLSELYNPSARGGTNNKGKEKE